ncbi:MAG: PBS lyase [Leptolyngbya sp. DLM2.Bin27]|nr:MAG: PBS lyase [Leptolyngbya sp. DLM2.Bin27]
MNRADSAGATTAPGAAAADASAAVTGLGAGGFHDRWEQSRQVADLGEAALADLLAMVQAHDQDWEARWFAARALGSFDRPEVIATLVATFATTADEDLRQAVAAALTQIGPAAIAALGQQLAQPALRPVAVQALARIHHPATVPLLLEVLADDRSPVRATALDALGTFADPATLPAMQRGLNDPSAAVRLAAMRGLLSLRSTLDPAALASWLAPLLDDLDLAAAQQAAYGLGRLPLAAATTPLLSKLVSPNTPAALQIAAVRALTWQNTAVALDGLIQAWDALGEAPRLALLQGLAGLEPALRAQAALALGAWLRTLPAIAAHSTLRRHLVLALGQLGSPAMAPELQALLHDPDPGVQIHAEAALRQLQLPLTQA